MIEITREIEIDSDTIMGLIRDTNNCRAAIDALRHKANSVLSLSIFQNIDQADLLLDDVIKELVTYLDCDGCIPF